jgi:ABC-type nitrate/sulfonate/bicarbonate transport system permease component
LFGAGLLRLCLLFLAGRVVGFSLGVGLSVGGSLAFVMARASSAVCTTSRATPIMALRSLCLLTASASTWSIKREAC